MNKRKSQINVYMDNDIKEELQQRAKELGVSASAFVNMAINEKLSQVTLLKSKDLLSSITTLMNKLEVEQKKGK